MELRVKPVIDYLPSDGTTYLVIVKEIEESDS